VNTATFSLATLAPAIPEILLLALVCTLLVVDLFLDDEVRETTYWLTLLSLVGVALITLARSGCRRASRSRACSSRT
jgi:NADH-quinone oxidoreductase subunit N